MISRRAATVFGFGNLLTAALIVGGVFFGLPSRWAVVDVPAAALAVLEVVSGAGLVFRATWAQRVGRATSGFALGIGLALASLLAVTASWLRGVYGPVGLGGSVVMSLVAALVLPYLVVLPLVQWLWLGSRTAPEPPVGR